MEIEIFTVCDFSEEISGKMVIVGTFDTIARKNFPAIHPNFSIAGRFRFSKEELGDHKFKILFVDAKGNNFLSQIEGGMNVKATPNREHTTVNFSINIGQAKFENPGMHTIQLYIDGKWKTGLYIYLIQK